MDSNKKYFFISIYKMDGGLTKAGIHVSKFEIAMKDGTKRCQAEKKALSELPLGSTFSTKKLRSGTYINTKISDSITKHPNPITIHTESSTIDCDETIAISNDSSNLEPVKYDEDKLITTSFHVLNKKKKGSVFHIHNSKGTEKHDLTASIVPSTGEYKMEADKTIPSSTISLALEANNKFMNELGPTILGKDSKNLMKQKYLELKKLYIKLKVQK